METSGRPLRGQRALVTGATSGIGRATALLLARMGAEVLVHYHSHPDRADSLVEEIQALGGHADAAGGDFRHREEVVGAVERLVDQKPLDILVNNAGTLIERLAFADMPWSLWDDTIALNLSSVFWAVRAALPHLADGARIVNVSSVAADSGGGPGAFAYAAAKGGVESLTRGLAKALGPRRIRVNAIAPGTIDTPYHEQYSTPEGLRSVAARVPLGRIGTAEECAQVIAFLSTDASSYMTGEVVTVHGGQGLTW